MIVQSEIKDQPELCRLAAQTWTIMQRCPIPLKAKLYRIQRGGVSHVEVHGSRPDGLPWQPIDGFFADDEVLDKAVWFAARRVLADAHEFHARLSRASLHAVNFASCAEASKAAGALRGMMEAVQLRMDKERDRHEVV